MDQLIQKQHEPVKTPTQQDAPLPTGPASIQSANVMIDPLQVLLASAPPVMGSPTITKEEDQLLGTEELTTEEVVARLPPQPIQDPQMMPPPIIKMTSSSLLQTLETIWRTSKLLIQDYPDLSETHIYSQLLTMYSNPAFISLTYL